MEDFNVPAVRSEFCPTRHSSVSIPAEFLNEREFSLMVFVSLKACKNHTSNVTIYRPETKIIMTSQKVINQYSAYLV